MNCPETSWCKTNKHHFIVLVESVDQGFRQAQQEGLVSAPQWLGTQLERLKKLGVTCNVGLTSCVSFFTHISYVWGHVGHLCLCSIKTSCHYCSLRVVERLICGSRLQQQMQKLHGLISLSCGII